MKFLFLILLFISPFIPQAPVLGDFIDDINVFFKSGNSNEVAKRFSTSVELSIIDEEDVYSKAQAEQILRVFFAKHNPTGSKVIHHIDTNPSMRFGILSMTSRKGNFRISITSKKVNQSFLITELRIDPEK